MSAGRGDACPPSQVTSSQLVPALSSMSLLVLAESEAEKKKWVRILEGLQSILAKNLLKSRHVHVLHEAYDASLPIIKSSLSAAVLGTGLGSSLRFQEPLEVLMIVGSVQIGRGWPWGPRTACSWWRSPETVRVPGRGGAERHGLTPRVSAVIVRAADSKKTYQIDLIPTEKVVALLCGRNRQVHLFPWEALDGTDAAFDVKLTDTKGCQALTTGLLRPGGPACLLAAVKRQVLDQELLPQWWRRVPVLTRPCPWVPGPVLRDHEDQAPLQEAVGGPGSGAGPVAGHGEGAALRGLPFWLRSAGPAGGDVPRQPGQSG